MVGLSDIPCVGVAIQKISEATVEAAFRGLRYTLCYKKVVNELNSEIGKVEIQEVAVSRKVDAALNDGKTIDTHVVKWQEDVENIKTFADELSRQKTSFTCFKVLRFPNLVSRFRLGKKAAHQSKKMAELTVSGREVVANEVGILPAVEDVPISNTTYHSFASRQEAYKKVWEALVDDSGNPIIAIYGMAGVGKTRMMEQAWKDAMDKKIFDKVARVNVSGEKLNVINLQDKLADSLDCNLQSKHNEMQRASQLKSSLTNGNKKILIILDDVWDVIPLKSVGIPFGDGTSKGCKILLTSRSQDVCLRNDCKDPIELKTLTDSEAWEMFQNTVGTSTIEPLKDALLAEKVCKKCAGLPLLIHAVGNALKCATENLWKEALSQLENNKFEEIERIDGQVYACVQLSFDMLKEKPRTCLLLCSLFPEDADIEIKMLFDLATGSQLLDCGTNIDAMIEILKSSSLLLEGKYDTVKLHDIIRDVARSIAAKDPKYAFLSVRCSSRLPDNVDYPSLRLLQLDLLEDNVCFPDDLACPDLPTLWLRGNYKSQQFASGFFQGFRNITFLLLQGMSCTKGQQPSIHRLEKLRVLYICRCDFTETFLSSISKKLEILYIWESSLPNTLELPELENLRKLELIDNTRGGFYGINMVGKAISSMSSLEELKLLGEVTILYDADADTTSIFAQLSQLTRFRKLMIDLNDSKSYPNEDLINKLIEFNINVRWNRRSREPRTSPKKSITFSAFYGNVENGWMAVVERAEKVELQFVNGLENVFSNSNTIEAFVNLRELTIEHCNNMKHVASWDGRNQELSSSFSNLTSVYIRGCGQLRYLFSASVAKCLQQMQQLRVDDCDNIKEIIRVEEGRTDGGEIICFPKLRELHLEDLPNLTSFYNYEVAFTSLEVWELDKASEIQRNDIYHKEDYSFSQLKVLSVICCDRLEYVLPVRELNQCKNLQQLEIMSCQSLKTVFRHSSTTVILEETSNILTVFPAVKDIFMNGLPNLESFWTSHQRRSYFIPKVMFPNMEKMTMYWLNSSFVTKEIELEVELPSHWLHQLRNIEILKLNNCWWTGDSFNGTRTFQRLRELEIEKCGVTSLPFSSLPFLQLQTLKVSDCPLLEDIVWGDEPHGSNGEKITSPPRLKSVSLRELPKLKKCGIFACKMPALEDVNVYECGVSTLFTSSAFTYLQQLRSIRVSQCPLLENIVEDAMHDETSNKTISLLCLTDIDLTYLSSLKSFCSSSFLALNLPALQNVTVYVCPCMDTFTLLEVSAPRVNIQTRNSSRKEISDLNSFVREKVYGREHEDNDSTTDVPSDDDYSYFYQY